MKKLLPFSSSFLWKRHHPQQEIRGSEAERLRFGGPLLEMFFDSA